MENKKNTLKISLSDDEMKSISGGLAVTKEILVDGLEAQVIVFNTSAASVEDGKNSPGDNGDIFNPKR